MTTGEKFAAIRNALSLPATAFGTPMGISKSHISGIESDKRRPSESVVNLMIRHYNVSPRWWETGEGPMFLPDHLASASTGFVEVKVYNRICCGDGVEPGGDEEIGSVYVPAKYDKPHIIMVRARGRSMEPTIKEGAYIGIDTADREILSGEMYAVCSQLEGAVVKRLTVKGDCLHLVSDNPVFESIEVRDMPSHFVIGRVRIVVNEY